MTRDRKTISAVFMAVVLVLASGAAVSFAVTATDDGTSAMGVQDTTTEATGDDAGDEDDDDAGDGDDAGDDQGDDAGEGDDAAAEEASVTIDDQESEGPHLVIESATLPEGGFVAIHSEGWADAPLSTVLGTSVYLEPGTHEDVNVTLARPLNETQTVVAMPHLDTNDNRVYDFVLSTGEFDGPYTQDGEIVVDAAEVTVTGANETTTTPTETTTTETPTETTTETTTEDDEPVDTTTTDVEETPDDGMERFVFKIEEMNIDRWSFVVGDEETPDETVYINGSEILPGDGTISDERVTINLSEWQDHAMMTDGGMMYTTTQSPEEIEEDIEENLTKDIPTVRYVVQNVAVENATLVVIAPSDVELPAQPPMTTDEEPATTTTTAEDDEDEEDTTTTEEEADTTTTTEEDDEDEEDTTTTEEAQDTTTEVTQSFEVSGLNAPATATVGETIEVSATISNPSDTALTQSVAFRLEGDVLLRQEVSLDAGEQMNVTFEVDTTGLEPAEYIHGVYTVNFGEVDVIVLEETTDDETETPETETPDTETPDTETPDTETPVTETPETETPETETPDTETPETETPVTETPDTETPETETPVTETPDTETPDTETTTTTTED